MNEKISEDFEIGELTNLIDGSGFPGDEVDFHPHGMALTPDWVNEEDKKLFVINHAWEKGGERIEVFSVNRDSDGNAESLEWLYAMGDLNDELEDGQELKDSQF